MRRLLVSAFLFATTTPAFGQVVDLGAPLPANPKVEQQMKGNFAPLKRKELTPGGAVQSVWSEATPTDAVYTVKWKPGEYIKTALREGMVTTIILPGGDDVDQVALGDQTNFGWQRTKQPDKLWVWVKAPGYDTSLTVIGESGNVYPFYLRGETWNSKNTPDLVVRVRARTPVLEPAPKIQLAPIEDPAARPGDPLPADSDPEATAEQEAEWLRELPFDPTEVRHDLVWSGDEAIAPYDIFRDDRFTYLDYGPNHDSRRWPVPFRVQDGIDHPVNIRKSLDGRFLIVETIDPITLRHGEQVVCIRRQES